MAQLLVRNIEESIVQKLREKAAADGVSMAEEHRRILRQSLLETADTKKMSFLDFLCTMPDAGDDADFARQRDLPREVNLED